MEFSPSDEAVAISEAVSSLVAASVDDDVVTRDARVTELGVEMGLRSLLLPEELGGLELDLATACGVLRVLGSVPTHVDWPGQLVGIPVALAAAAPSSEALAKTATAWAEGSISLELVAPGRRTLTRSSSDADVLELDGDALRVAGASAWTETATHTLAGAPGTSVRTVGDDVDAQPLPTGAGARVLASGRVGAAAFLMGSGRAALDRAVAHAGVREQFGRPIGSYQAVKHLLAGALEALTMADPLVAVAAHSVQAGADSSPLDAALAVRQAGEAAEQAVRAAIQVHGALAYTDETPLGGLLAQVRATRAAWAPTSGLETFVAEALFDGVAASAVHIDEEGL